MQNATDPVRPQPQPQPEFQNRAPGQRQPQPQPRPPVSHAAAINAANNTASTNSTLNRFLGTNQRSWMRPGLGISTATPTITTSTAQPVTPTNNNTPKRGRGRPRKSLPSDLDSTTSAPNLNPTTSLPPTTVHPTPAVQPSNSSSDRPLPAYRFLSAVPEVSSTNAPRDDAGQEEQEKEHSAAGPEPRNDDNGPDVEESGITLRPDAEAAPAPTSGDGVEVVDLTFTQPDPIEHEPTVLPTNPEALNEIDAMILLAADTTGPAGSSTTERTRTIPQVVGDVVSADASEFWQSLTATTTSLDHARSTSNAHPVSGPPELSSAPTEGTRRSASISAASDGQTAAAAAATFYRPPSTQLLTPVASPSMQHNDHLQRKRPGIDPPSVQHPQTRLRTESPQTSPLARQLPFSNTPLQSPPQDQPSHRRSHTYLASQQPPQRHSVPQRPSSTALMSSHQQLHSGVMPRTGSYPVVVQPHRAPIQGSAAPVPGRGQAYLAGFDTTIAEMRRRIDLSDRPQLRLPWIRDACQNNDLFFLLLNQLLCIWHFNKELLIELGLDASCSDGFRTLELLFASNTELPEELLAFLAGWPNSTYSLKANAELKQWVANIGQFLPQLGRHWEDFRTNCMRRRCPPTAREITDAFQCPPSTVLPRAIFSSLARQVQPAAPLEFQNAAYELFRMNQHDYFNSLFQRRHDRSLAEDFNAFGLQYNQLLEQYWRRASGSIVPSGGQPSLPDNRTALTRDPFTLPSDRDTGGLATAPRNTAPLNLDLINSIATGVTTPMRVISSPANGSAPRTRPVVNTGSEMLHNRVQASPVVHSPANGMGPIQSGFARTNFQAFSPLGPQASSAPASRVNNSQNRTQIFRPNPQSHASQPLLPDLRNLPPFLTNPVPEQEALHLAHLRQPLTEVKDAKTDEPPRLYQSIQSCAFGPHPFSPELAFFEVSFELSPDLVRRKAEIIGPAVGSQQLPKRIFTTDSLLFNLRCVQLKVSEDLPDESDWAALPTCYPQHIFISINDEHLEVRRKRHFRKDLPIDVTPFVKDGDNKIKVSIHGEKSEEGKKFAMAVEVIGLQDHTQAFKMPTKIPAEESLRNITSTMQPAADGDDDDMQVVNDNIILSITDPFLSSMFTIPVRGKKCKHRECFDLETFLRSRMSDNKDALTSVYEWRCPTCSKDARPASLVIDGFLQSVRDQLVEAGNTDARAIIVKEDGSWVVKQEVDREANGGASRGDSRQPGRDREKSESQSRVTTDQAAVMPQAQNGTDATSTGIQPTASRIIEIIELDDD